MACAAESLRGKTELISHLPPVCMNGHPLCWKKCSAPTAHSSAASTAALRADEGRTSKCPWILPWPFLANAQASPSVPQDKKQTKKERNVIREAPTGRRKLILYFQHYPFAHVFQQAYDLIMPQLGQVNAIHRLDVIPNVQLVTSAKKERGKKKSSGSTKRLLCSAWMFLANLWYLRTF